ncbi:MAG: DUF364 domain-containing protein [Deltaproteobacteria bacterium]|nr:DUF364 domain-containing protein [Deltaproteobacteria bacterium]
MESQNIIQAWTSDLRQVLGNEPLTVDDVRIGVFYTAAQLSDGHVGVAFTPRGLTVSVCCPQSAAEAPPAGRMAGRNAWALAEYAGSPVSLRRAVGVATLNALSALALTRREMPEARLLPGVDALDAAEVQPDDRVTLVGAFVPFIKKIKDHVSALWVIDKHPEALKPDEKHLWCPPEQALGVLAEASVVIMTGSTLVEGGTDELLEAARGARRVVMAGPTASPWPPTFFAHGVDVLGGIRVTDGPKLLQIVSQGGSGYFFGQGAEKICFVRVGK